MKNRLRDVIAVATVVAWLSSPAGAQQPRQGQTDGHEVHHREMLTRGAQAMGFDQERTVHHFFLYEDGGAIEVAVNQASDHANLHAIRQHLPEIAGLFKAGDFGKPALTHAQQVPGTAATMRQRVDTGNDPGLPIESEALHSIFKNYDKIETKVETTEKGVVVVQTSTDPETVAALQQHASEVTDFVKDGMAAMRTAMMKNAGGMMRTVPNGGTSPNGR